MRWIIVIWLVIIVWATLLMRAPAHDWTGEQNPDVAQWFSRLHRKVDNLSCCGLGDAYKVRILVEADPTHAFDQTGVAEITDGSSIDEDNIPMTMDGAHTTVSIHRTPLPTGMQFKFRYSELAREAEGNPTNSAWAFLSVWNGNKTPADNYLSQVYCIVPLPPNS